MERRLAAILAIDMVGYSRLMGTDESGTITRQKLHREVFIDPQIARYTGRIVKTTGDGLLAEFPSVVDAVDCALAFQTELLDEERDIPEEKRILYRAGINLGDIVIDGEIVGGCYLSGLHITTTTMISSQMVNQIGTVEIIHQEV